MMSYTRKVIMGAGLAFILTLTEASARADVWYREHGLASYYGKGFHGRTAADGNRFSHSLSEKWLAW
jgi:rare lipoprotein A (peptidoglycan hydrolase)